MMNEALIPIEKAGHIIGKAKLEGFNSGKVKTGMKVQVRLDGFSYKEYGVLNGFVKRIANVPGQDGYEVEIDLPNNLITSYQDTISFRQEMQGTARIITEDRSLLMRILEDLRSAFEE